MLSVFRWDTKVQVKPNVWMCLLPIKHCVNVASRVKCIAWSGWMKNTVCGNTCPFFPQRMADLRPHSVSNAKHIQHQGRFFFCLMSKPVTPNSSRQCLTCLLSCSTTDLLCWTSWTGSEEREEHKASRWTEQCLYGMFLTNTENKCWITHIHR